MATVPATYDIRDDFDVNADLSDNASLISSSDGAAGIAPFWSASFTDVTISGGRLNSITTLAGVILNINPSVVGFDSRVMVGLSVEAEFSTPGAGFSSLSISAFNEDFSSEINPTLQLNSSGSVFFGLQGDLATASPASSTTHILKMVVAPGYTIDFYVDGVLVGSRSAAGVNWLWQLALNIRNGAYVQYIHAFGEDALDSAGPEPEPPEFWTDLVNTHEVV